MTKFSIETLDERQGPESPESGRLSVGSLDDLKFQLYEKRVLVVSTQIVKTFPDSPYGVDTKTVPIQVSELSQTDLDRLTARDEWTHSSTLVFQPGPKILISHYLWEGFSKLFTLLGFTPIWARPYEDLVTRARETPPDVALEWHDMGNATPIKDLIDELDVVCPVLLCRNRGLKNQQEAMSLGFDGMVRYPEGNVGDLVADIQREIAEFKTARKRGKRD